VGELRVQYQQVFRQAPKWSPLSRVRLPAVRFVPWYRLDAKTRPVWGQVRWQRRLGPVTLRSQWQRVFPQAPAWSPASKVALPVLRVVPTVRPRRRPEAAHGHQH
jgi:hypothetical protein